MKKSLLSIFLLILGLHAEQATDKSNSKVEDVQLITCGKRGTNRPSLWKTRWQLYRNLNEDTYFLELESTHPLSSKSIKKHFDNVKVTFTQEGTVQEITWEGNRMAAKFPGGWSDDESKEAGFVDQSKNCENIAAFMATVHKSSSPKQD